MGILSRNLVGRVKTLRYIYPCLLYSELPPAKRGITRDQPIPIIPLILSNIIARNNILFLIGRYNRVTTKFPAKRCDHSIRK